MSGEGGTRKDISTVTVRVPMTFCRRGGRKAVVTPDGAAAWAPRPRVDNTLVKALARAHRWKRMLESGDYASVAELAAAERINSSYLSRVLRLTLLAPDIVETILNGRQPEAVTLDRLLKPFPSAWKDQTLYFLGGEWPVARIETRRVRVGGGLMEEAVLCG